jgi:hypothetical protein
MKLKIRSMKKAQVITFDFSTSLIVFILFMAVFIGIFILSQAAEKKQEFELEYVFANLENNLRFSPNPGIDFFSDYRVDKAKLTTFVSLIGAGSIDDYVIGTVGNAHGIGLNPSGYSTCLYFTDNNGSRININGITALGYLNKRGASCEDVFSTSTDPCEEYENALAIFKPVLFDENDVYNNRIIQMNLVICKK